MGRYTSVLDVVYASSMCPLGPRSRDGSVTAWTTVTARIHLIGVEDEVLEWACGECHAFPCPHVHAVRTLRSAQALNTLPCIVAATSSADGAFDAVGEVLRPIFHLFAFKEVKMVQPAAFGEGEPATEVQITWDHVSQAHLHPPDFLIGYNSMGLCTIRCELPQRVADAS